MSSYIEEKLLELRNEMELGQKQLAALEARAAELRNTLFRISGAIQVLEDVLAHNRAAAAAQNGEARPDARHPAS